MLGPRKAELFGVLLAIALGAVNVGLGANDCFKETGVCPTGREGVRDGCGGGPFCIWRECLSATGNEQGNPPNFVDSCDGTIYCVPCAS